MSFPEHWFDHGISIPHFLSALSHPIRLHTLFVLSESQMHVAGLAAEMGVLHSTMSRHLGALEGTGLVDHVRIKKSSVYRLTDRVRADVIGDQRCVEVNAGHEGMIRLTLAAAAMASWSNEPPGPIHGLVRRTGL